MKCRDISELTYFNYPMILLFSILGCDCNLNNSITEDCDSYGICTCKENYIGLKCTKCADDLAEYPECKGNYTLIPEHFY